MPRAVILFLSMVLVMLFCGRVGQSQTPERRDPVSLINELLDRGKHHEAIRKWEQLSSSHAETLTWEPMAWKLAQAYSRLKQYDKAIQLYKRFYVSVDSLSIQERADIGEELVFGRVGARPDGYGVLGRGACSLCHLIEFPEISNFDPHAPAFKGVIARARRWIKSPEYEFGHRNTVQPESFPGSGNATTVMEYLAESHVCPSCFVVPGFGVRGTQDRESLEPALHKPSLNLTIDELIAIDTWLYLLNGEQPPPLNEMQAAYSKFLQEDQRPGSPTGIKLAALHDAKGDTDKAIQILEENYSGFFAYYGTGYAPDNRLEEWKIHDPEMFSNLKHKPNIVSKFPKLLRVERKSSRK